MSDKVRHTRKTQAARVEPAEALQVKAEKRKKNAIRNETKNANFVSIYANDVQLQTTPWDIRFVFSVIDVSTEVPRTLNVDQLGEVRLSPQLAAKFVELLAGQLTTYEERFGRIPGPIEKG